MLDDHEVMAHEAFIDFDAFGTVTSRLSGAGKKRRLAAVALLACVAVLGGFVLGSQRPLSLIGMRDRDVS